MDSMERVTEKTSLGREVRKYTVVYLMIAPAIVLVLIFSYIPMYGVLIAFKDYEPLRGIMGGEWVGLKNFRFLFSDPYFYQLVRNTLVFSVYNFLVGFIMPILFALAINEIWHKRFRQFVQVVSYMPYFVSTVVICGMAKSFLSFDGALNSVLSAMGLQRVNLLSDAGWFRPICALTTLWQTVGWNSIIYVAAISGIDLQLIDAARVDGCKRLQLIYHVIIPGILPTIMVMFILSMGTFISAPTELILLLYSPLTYETGDVLGTYIHRIGIQGGSYQIAAAIGLISNFISMLLLIVFNWLSRRTTEQSLW